MISHYCMTKLTIHNHLKFEVVLLLRPHKNDRSKLFIFVISICLYYFRRYSLVFLFLLYISIQGLSMVEEKKGKRAISFDRLAVCREAFERIIKLNRECAPQLKHIMVSNQ